MKTVPLNPRFVYTPEVQTLKEFLEQLYGAHVTPGDDEREKAVAFVLAGVTGPGLLGAISAMSEILANDIDLQIRNGSFPLERKAQS